MEKEKTEIDKIDAKADVPKFERINDGIEGFDDSVFNKFVHTVGNDSF